MNLEYPSSQQLTVRGYKGELDGLEITMSNTTQTHSQMLKMSFKKSKTSLF